MKKLIDTIKANPDLFAGEFGKFSIGLAVFFTTMLVIFAVWGNV